MFSIAVLVSGRGSNLNSILNAPSLRNLVEVKAVVSNKADCPAFDVARKYAVPVYSVGIKEGYLSFDEIGSLFISLRIDLIVLAGFLKLIPANFIESFRDKIINIHPAILPSFGGAGMYGMNVHKAVFDASAQVSGASIHFVDESYDTGKIIAQRCVDISDVKSPEELAERVLKIEHQLLPYVIEKFALGKVFVDKTRVRVLN